MILANLGSDRFISISKPDWRLIAFYIGVPVLLPLYTSLHNWEFQQAAGYLGTAAFYLAHSIIPWWITCISTFGIMKLLARWKPAPVIIMVIGSILGGILTLPYYLWITDVFLTLWPADTMPVQQLQVRAWSGDFFNYVFRALVIWLIVNFIFDRFVGLPRYRYSIPKGYESTQGTGRKQAQQNNAGALPAFLLRLPAAVEPDEILAIKAEQHYVRIITAERDYMVLYRFSDALRQIGTDLGMQVHRSWWVAYTAIEALQQGGKKLFVVLMSEEKIPVSAPYQGLIKEVARSRGIMLRPLPPNESATAAS